MSDSDIINNVINGHKNDYRFLVEKYQEQVFRACMGYVHNEDDANDLTQDTFVNAYQNIHKFEFNASFSTWLYRIAINLSLNYLRAKRRNIFERIENALDSLGAKKAFSIPGNSNPEDAIIDREQKQLILREIQKLSDKQKTAFILSKYEDLSQKQIAEIMQISEGAVESLIQRAKANLRKKIIKNFKKN